MESKYDTLIKAIKALATKILPEGSQVALYGSRARGDARMDSDWDIIILIPGEERIPLNIIEKYADPFDLLGWDYDEMVCSRVYSYAGWKKRSFLPFYKNVEHDKKIIFQN